MERVFVVALALVATGVLGACGEDARAPLRVTWRESEGHPACTYDRPGTVTVRLVVTGDAGDRDTVTATVTAYADENTSVPVGSVSRSVRVHGAVHEPVDLSIPVTKAPHVDEDGVAACRLEVGY